MKLPSLLALLAVLVSCSIFVPPPRLPFASSCQPLSSSDELALDLENRDCDRSYFRGNELYDAGMFARAAVVYEVTMLTCRDLHKLALWKLAMADFYAGDYRRSARAFCAFDQRYPGDNAGARDEAVMLEGCAIDGFGLDAYRFARRDEDAQAWESASNLYRVAAGSTCEPLARRAKEGLMRVEGRRE